MTDISAFWQSKLQSAGKGNSLQIKRITRQKHRDLLLVLSVSLGFGMLLIFSVVG